MEEFFKAIISIAKWIILGVIIISILIILSSGILFGMMLQ
jgi:hypothetical protein